MSFYLKGNGKDMSLYGGLSADSDTAFKELETKKPLREEWNTGPRELEQQRLNIVAKFNCDPRVFSSRSSEL